MGIAMEAVTAMAMQRQYKINKTINQHLKNINPKALFLF